ncbi:hypothetical protein PU634_05725 [Oceanimonas pelagia]|uniref:Oxidoreductase molybdopterin-binding domain-containing protein n=1 Tax=Oceanimonas pelagia TaxID=3028314 RepID=A0AA50KQI2_9GAMM|nr:hypothetical protein [Oceanimonas pelagia]WMC11864.1 hypothetical protein PU634_05725 [Oceanimonas pelagia]
MHLTIRFATVRPAAWPGILALLLLLTGWSARAAGELPTPEGRVILTVTGNVKHTNSAHGARFDMAMLEQLPQQEFVTDTPWTDGQHHFRGVELRALLQRLGAEGKRLRLVALNDYHHDIDMALVNNMPFVLATHMDGKTMKIRDKGPVWLMLPLSGNAQYNTKRFHEMLVWQLKTLEIQ